VGYRETLQRLYALEGRLGMDFRLERLEPVLGELDHPELAFESIHIGGTNGKGSTAAMVHSVLTRSGHRCGMYTSPHLTSFRERIRVGDSYIAQDDVVRLAARVEDAAGSVGVTLTFFEIVTIMAFLAFREAGIDLAVVEVGLGGRLDATNVVRSSVVAITSIALDHAEYLGATVAEVAREKAGIIKPDAVLVTGPLPDAAMAPIDARVRELGVRWQRFGRDFGLDEDLRPRLPGPHQLENAAVAAACVRALRATRDIGESRIREGVAAAVWPGRFDVVGERPTVVFDGAHNPHAARALVEAIEEQRLGRPRILVFGVMADKDWAEMLGILAPRFDRVLLVPVARRRALDPRIAATAVASEAAPEVAVSIAAGLNEASAIAGTGGAVVVTGSIFLIGEAYQVIGREVGVSPDAVLD
jgi:dihydrofolate synthase/folylpolyglutamate synthase